MLGTSSAIIGSALVNALMQGYTNKANIAANESRFAEQTELANTAHQREVADLRLAGLNPILSTGTAGAAVPSQQAPDIQSPSLGELGAALNSARMTKAQIANIDQNLIMNEPRVQASKVLNEFYKTDEGRETLKDIERMKGAPKTPYEAAYLGMSKVESAKPQDTSVENPSAAKPSFKSKAALLKEAEDKAHDYRYGNRPYGKPGKW